MAVAIRVSDPPPSLRADLSITLRASASGRSGLRRLITSVSVIITDDRGGRRGQMARTGGVERAYLSERSERKDASGGFGHNAPGIDTPRSAPDLRGGLQGCSLEELAQQR